MKKHVVVGTAALVCSMGVWAQSSVTVFGFIEAQVARVPGTADDTKAAADFGGSRLGFKGTEDLGGGNKASFYLEHRLNPGDGTSGGGATFWKGGSWVGLSNDQLGSVKLGRWWSQAFLKSQYAADPFGMGTMGEGAYGSVGCGPNFSGGCLGAFWVNNSVSYENSFGGFSFGAQVGETPTGGSDRPFNVGASYGAGPLYIGVGHEAHNGGASDNDWTTFAANYDFGAVKLFAGYGSGHDAANVSRKNILAGFSAPVGPGAIIVSYDMQDQGGTRVEQLLSAGYKYNFSARTNVFLIVANDSKAPAGTDKTGYALGMFHSF